MEGIEKIRNVNVHATIMDGPYTDQTKPSVGRAVVLMTSRRAAAVLCVAVLASACSYSHFRTGPDNVWREGHDFVRGETRIGDVLSHLGPPTQVLGLGPRTALLYFLTENRNDSFDIGVYKNRTRIYVTDRAMYFFDKAGVLEDMAVSKTALPRNAEYLHDPWGPLPDQPVVPDQNP